MCQHACVYLLIYEPVDGGGRGDWDASGIKPPEQAKALGSMCAESYIHHRGQILLGQQLATPGGTLGQGGPLKHCGQVNFKFSLPLLPSSFPSTCPSPPLPSRFQTGFLDFSAFQPLLKMPTLRKRPKPSSPM